ncbi:hypothetical protein JCM11491_002690 [Sporobolomyces phaffii]
MKPSTLEPRPFRSSRPQSSSSFTRPLSATSSLSISAVSSSSSITGERRRRSSALLEGMNMLEDTPGRRSIRNSITRAEEVLRASERQRELERRKERAGLRSRQVGRSTRILDHWDDDASHDLDRRDGYDSLARRTRPNSDADRILRKARSIPSELLLSPVAASSDDSVDAHREGARASSRPASSAAILNPREPRILSIASRARPRADDRSLQLAVPAVEPTSKFSASSGDSLVHVAFNERPSRLNTRARSFNQASTNGFKSFGNKLKAKTPSKVNLRKKPSLAGIFRDIVEAEVDGGEDAKVVTTDKRPQPSSSSSRFGTGGHRASTSVSSCAPSTDRDSRRRESSRLGFFRSALRDSTTTSSSDSRPRSTGTISPSIISNPVSTSSGGDTFDERRSGATESSGTSSGKGGRKIGWVTKLGRTIRRKHIATAKRTIVEDAKEDDVAQESTVHIAEKVKVGNGLSRENTTRPPAHVPVTSLFEGRTAPLRPRRPSSGLVSSDDTTFYGHSVLQQQQKSALSSKLVDVVPSSAPRVRAKPTVVEDHPVAAACAARRAYSSNRPRPETPLPFSNLVLLPAADIVASPSLPGRKLTLDQFEQELARHEAPSPSRSLLAPVSPSSSLDDSDPSTTSSAGPFRSPSPARFRDLLPSSSASSPEKNENGLPMPLGASPASARSGGSPIRRRVALGPEQIICMTDARERSGPISQVRGATTDLAELLSGLDETQEYDRSRTFTAALSPQPLSQPAVPPLPPVHRHEIPRLESMNSLRSTVSDVPNDLKDLIDAVDSHISEVDVLPLVVDGNGMNDRGFADEGFDSFSSCSSESESDSSGDERVARVHQGDGPCVSTRPTLVADGFTTDEGANWTATRFDSTASTFEGHVSTAAHVLRDMLDGGAPRRLACSDSSESCDMSEAESSEESDEVRDERDQPSSLRDSVREALDVGRPSAGERMFDSVDSDVSLSALVDESVPSSPDRSLSRPSLVAASFFLGHFRHERVISSSEGSTESTGISLVHSSPTPNPDLGRPLRRSLARYSQDWHATGRGLYSSAGSASHGSSSISSQPSSDPTVSSNAPSSRSTNLSITSTTSSPCPVPRHRRIPMLTRARPPPLQPLFRFPANKIDVASATLSDWNVSRPLMKDTFDPIPELRPLTIVEEDEPSATSPFHSIGVDFRLEPFSPTVETYSPSFCYRAATSDDDHGAREADKDAEGDDDILDTSEDDYDWTARDPDDTRKFVHLRYEAETEIRQSRALWPDTDRSREAVALFDAPKSFRAILEFLFSSHARFPPPPPRPRHVVQLDRGVPLACVGPPLTPPSPLSPVAPIKIPSPLRESTSSWTFPADPLPATIACADDASPPRRPKVAARAVLGRKVLGDKSVNVVGVADRAQPPSAIASSTKVAGGDNDALSPFTALPPRLGANLRAASGRGRFSARSSAGSFDGGIEQQQKKKVVDVRFLGDAVSHRRQVQFNAAARRLEGTGRPSEQRSDDDDTTGDHTGALLRVVVPGRSRGVLEADGEATIDSSFAKFEKES